MRIIKPSVEILTDINGEEVIKKIEEYGRVCYKSESKITKDSAEKFIKRLIKNGHLSVIEHFSISVRIICDRAVTHELVRHRIASYSQESTRYVNYKEGIEVIAPCFWEDDKYKSSMSRGKAWADAMQAAETAYKLLIDAGATPQEARTVLPNSLKTEIVCTMNLRAWRHFFKLRCDKTAHPQMRQIAFMLLIGLSKKLPVIFEDIMKEHFDGTKD